MQVLSSAPFMHLRDPAERKSGLDMMKIGATEVPAEAEVVYELLEQPGNFDLLHFACHGAADAADIGTARREMLGKPRSDGSMSEEDILATTVRYEAELRAVGYSLSWSSMPARADPAAIPSRVWAASGEAFIVAGVGIFVDSSWTVGDKPAFTFMNEFYAQFVDARKPLATATAAARKKAHEDGVPRGWRTLYTGIHEPGSSPEGLY